MAEYDFDMVSDLNDGTADHSVAANTGDVPAHGVDATHVNNPNPVKEEENKAKVIDDTPKPDADKPKSLRDQISSALKAEGETPDAAAQDGRVRNPDGTFAPKAAEPPVDPNAAPAAQPIAAPQGIDPAVFSSLPAETQASLARTMDEISQNQQRFAPLATIEQLIAPRREAWALNGMTPDQALNMLLSYSDFAGREPAKFIQQFAEQNGVDLEELVLGAEPVDPEYKKLQDEIATLKGVQSQFTQQQQQAAHNASVDQVVSFATEKGQDGKPLRPYFAEMGDDVLPYISAAKAKNPNGPSDQVLQQAYENACWAIPAIRSKMQAATQAAADAERLRTSGARVDAARTASASVAPGAPTQAPLAPDDKSLSLRDSIRNSIAASSGT